MPSPCPSPLLLPHHQTPPQVDPSRSHGALPLTSRSFFLQGWRTGGCLPSPRGIRSQPRSAAQLEMTRGC